MTNDTLVARAFLDYSMQKLAGEYWPRLRHCVESLTEEQLWWRPNEASNSIGNILLHLNGNVAQWILAGLGRRDRSRDRPSEFRRREPVARAVLLEQLGATVNEAARVIGALSAVRSHSTAHDSGLSGNRPRSGVPRGRALRHALRPDYLHHETASRIGPRLLLGTGLDRPSRMTFALRVLSRSLRQR